MIDDQLRETPERSDNWLATDLGVDQETVTARRMATATPENRNLPSPDLLPERVVGRDGSDQPYRPRQRLEEQARRAEESGRREDGESQSS